jgi:hypothetical protein
MKLSYASAATLNTTRETYLVGSAGLQWQDEFRCALSLSLFSPF